MFDLVGEIHSPGFDDGLPEDDFDGVWERRLARAEARVVLGLDPPFDWVPEQDPDSAPRPGYDNHEPSGWLALELDTGTADPARLSDADLVEGIIGFDRLTSWAAARQARLLAELAHRRPPDRVPNVERASEVSEFAPDEVGIALTLSRGTAAARLHLAARLLTVLPATHALWETGRIDTGKARAIHDTTVVLPDDQARAVQARVLPRAPGQTLAQLKAALARAVLAVDPRGADERHRDARHDRRVVVTPEPDGMASLWALLPATDAVGAYQWLTRLARGLDTGPDTGQDAKDPRTLDARRADLLAALLTGRLVTDNEGSAATGRPIAPVTPGKPLVQIVMAHTTLTGADDHPADLAGYGPIPATLARHTAADAVWRRLLTDPTSGTVLDYGRTTYHPPAALADHVRVRDLHCRFPGCQRTARDTELDHAVAWADGGDTSATNLHALCLHHHLLKHHPGWTITTHPDGRLTWTTPTGHQHTTQPHDYGGPEPPDPPATAPPSLTPHDPGSDPPPF